MNALNHTFAHPWMLWLLVLLPLWSLFRLFLERRRRRVLARLGRLPLLAGLAEGPRQWPFLRQLCLGLGTTALALGAAGPQWGREPQVELMPGRDLVVAVDLSRSMLTDDVPPHRLARARQALLELADAVQRRGGHRLALVGFAARPKLFCPLTHDYDHFREKVEQLDARFLPPELQTRPEDVSGTRIGLGLLQAMQAHELVEENRGFQDVLLISDGDDPADDHDWELAIHEALTYAVPINTVGIGDPQSGGRVPAPGGLLEYDGKVVVSRLKEKPLEEIAQRTGGRYLAARTGPVRLGEFFQDWITSRAAHEISADSVPVYRQRYPWFLATALGLFTLEVLIGRRRPRAPAPPQEQKPPTPRPEPLAA
jgi:Ca-activated chloride channel family protein